MQIENVTLPTEGYIDFETVQKVLPISATGYWRGVKKGLFPKPKKIPYGGWGYDVVKIREVIASL